MMSKKAKVPGVILLPDFENVLQNHLTDRATVYCTPTNGIMNIAIERLVIFGAEHEGCVAIAPNLVRVGRNKADAHIVCNKMHLLKQFGIELTIDPIKHKKATLEVKVGRKKFLYALTLLRYRYPKGSHAWTFHVQQV